MRSFLSSCLLLAGLLLCLSYLSFFYHGKVSHGKVKDLANGFLANASTIQQVRQMAEQRGPSDAITLAEAHQTLQLAQATFPNIVPTAPNNAPGNQTNPNVPAGASPAPATPPSLLNQLPNQPANQPSGQNFNQNSNQSRQNLITSIRIDGADKIDPKTILVYLTFRVGEGWQIDRINSSVKNLYNTGLFETVDIVREGNVAVIRIKENPTIDYIAFEGNDNVEDKNLLSVIGIQPRSIYSRAKVKKAVDILQQAYLQQGYFSANVTPKLIQLPENRVQLIFEIKEGNYSRIEAIEFYGNRDFSNEKLRSTILSAVYNPLRFFATNSSYDPERLKADKNALTRFYREQGYASALVVSAKGELNESRSAFILSFVVQEGSRYRLGDIKIVSNIKGIPIEQLKSFLRVKKGNFYKISSIEESENNLAKELKENYNFPFIAVNTTEIKNDAKGTLDLTFQINEGQKAYLNRINITGNTRTLDSVIRRRIDIAEGDPLDQDKVRIAVARIQQMGYFSQVAPNLVPVPGRPDRVDLNIEVQESSTGALNFSAGYSTRDGVVLGVTLAENNLLGSGKILSFNGSFAIPVTADQGSTFGQSYSLSYTEPFLADRDLAMTVSLYRTVSDNTASQYTSTRNGGSISFRFAYNQYVYQSLNYNFYQNNISLSGDPAGYSPYFRDQIGTYYVSSIGQTLAYDRRDNPADPKNGVIVSLSNDFAGLFGSVYYFKTLVSTVLYYTPPVGLDANDPTIVIGLEGGYIFPFNNRKLFIFDRFFLGGQNLRGFQDNSVGPVDTAGGGRYYIGGRQYFTQSTELRFPIGFLSDIGAKFIIFNDIGYLAYPEEKGYFNVNDSTSLRASWGVGASFITPVGPLIISWGFPYRSSPTDTLQQFRFDFRSRF